MSALKVADGSDNVANRRRERANLRARWRRLVGQCPEPYRATLVVVLTHGPWPPGCSAGADIARQGPLDIGSAAKVRRHLRWLVAHGWLDPGEINGTRWMPADWLEAHEGRWTR